MPTVSVVIPTYNRADLLEEALSSVLQQTYQDFEVIIVDDGSTDDTRERVAALQSDPRMRYVYQENHGLAGARNTGIRASRGDYIALLDDDDIWLPDKLEKQMSLMAVDDQADVVHCDFRFVDLACNPLPMRYQRPASRGTLYEDLMYGNMIAGSGSAVLIRARCLAEVGLFDENLPACEDQDLWRRMALAQHNFVYLDEVLLYIRWHTSNMQKDPERMAIAWMQYLDKLRLEAPPPFRRHLPEVAYLTYSRIVFSFLGARCFSQTASFVARIAPLGPRYVIRFSVELLRYSVHLLMGILSRLKQQISPRML